jgi:guanine deaminase
MSLHFYLGTILNPQSDRKCDYYAAGMLVTEARKEGAIIKEILQLKAGWKKYSSQMTSENTTAFDDGVILPAFFDMHFHWVQDDVREMPKDSLLQWLDLYTFPAETKFADADYAKQKAHEFFRKLVRAGTLGGACYSSIHEHAVDAAMKEVKGDFVIGNVLMNQNSPPALTQSPKESLAITKRLIKKYGQRYVFTPRFAITTDPAVMKSGSKLADQAKCFKQSHLSETPAEIDFVLSWYQQKPGFEKVANYTEIYAKTGMLGRRSLMGHGIHLSTEELKILSKTKTALIHCPTSNAGINEQGLGSGLFDFRKIEKAKVRWALGSDIGGGPFLSMFDVMRSYVDQNARAKIKGATFIKALYRATLAGAELLEVEKKAGNLNPKKFASFIVVAHPSEDTPKTAEALLQSLVTIHAHERKQYDTMVDFVSYRGEVLFDQTESDENQYPYSNELPN